jgi:hypothetical protein
MTLVAQQLLVCETKIVRGGRDERRFGKHFETRYFIF